MLHNCARVFKFGSIVTYKWIANHFMNQILQKPKMCIRKLNAKVSKKFNLIASVGLGRNARKYAFQEIKGSLKEHYAKTWSYGEEIKRTNPGSTVKMDVDVMPDGTTYFYKFYVCFKGLKDGWIEGCRRVIGLDGCFLKGICRGQLLSAIGRDANNHIYHIAWAVWFIDLLIEDLGMGVGDGLTLLSYQHKAMKERVPAAEHRQCARHICAKFMKRLIGLEMHMKMKIKGQSWDLTICPSIRLNFSKLKDLQSFQKLYHLVINSMKSDLGMMHMLWTLVAGHVPVEVQNKQVTLVCMGMLPLQASTGMIRLLRRPSTKRKRDQIERENKGKKHSVTNRGSVMKCNICRESGHNITTCPQKPIEESSNASSKRKKPKKTSKVKVSLANEVDIESDSEVEMEPESEVESFDVEFEDDVQANVQPKVQAQVHPEAQAEVQPEVQVQVEDDNQITVQDQMEVLAFQVVVGQRARKPS
uniref:MULE transposase domain-containing protein n=1 Tax=Lactuca sativa TaxID=4236 RepID=A0A9R1WPU7_LACSA|nr:hypothetical protein LSAT_V11C900458210 [Lactuca sativa]